MKKDEILNASRKEHRNKDLAEMEVVYQAGSHASRVGALVCCLLSLLSSVLAHTMIYSPWVIYFSIIATQWLVRFIKMKRKSDLVLTVLFFVLSILAFVGFVSHLLDTPIRVRTMPPIVNCVPLSTTGDTFLEKRLIRTVEIP